jgi:large subunit ribosomal protein L24
MSKLHIKKGDTVFVNSGEDKGKTGKVLKVLLKATCYCGRYEYGI